MEILSSPALSAILRHMGKFGAFASRLKETVARIKDRKNVVAQEETEEVPPIRLSDEAMAFIRTFSADGEGGRKAASEESRSFARKIAAEFRNFADTTITTLRISPDVEKAMTVIASVFSLSMFLLINMGVPYLAVAFSMFYIVQFYNELTKGKNRFRRFFMTAEASNVHAVIEPEGECTHTVVFTSHHDTAEIRRKEEGIKGILSSLLPLVVSYASLSLLSLIMVVVETAGGRLLAFNRSPLVVFILSLILLLPSVSAYFHLKSYTGRFAPGAGDNLSGLAVVRTLLHYFSREKKEGRGLSSVRLVFASFDGEECGTAGSLGWFGSNSHLLTDPLVINFDGIYKEDDLVFLVKDGNGLIPLSFSLASRCSRTASSMGYRMGVGKLGFLGGETDAASAAVQGIPAVTLTSMAPGTDTPAHTEEDTPDKVSEEAVSRAISVAIKLVAEVDGADDKGKGNDYLGSGRRYKISKY